MFVTQQLNFIAAVHTNLQKSAGNYWYNPGLPNLLIATGHFCCRKVIAAQMHFNQNPTPINCKFIIHPPPNSGEYQRWSPWGRPWPRGHILKSLALASKPQVFGLEALGPRKLSCPRLEDSTIFWTVEILLEYARNLAENLQIIPFLFSAIGALA